MRTLFISNLVPHRRVFYMLRSLSRFSQVTLVCPTFQGERAAQVAAWQSLCAEMFHYQSPPYGVLQTDPVLTWLEWKVRYLYPRWPIEMQFARSPAGAEVVRRLRPETYDLVWVERLQSMQLLPRQIRTRVVVDLDDIYTRLLAARMGRGPLYRGALWDFLEYLKWRRLETGLGMFPYTFLVCSEVDKQFFDRGTRVEVIPNGIDLPENEAETLGQETQRPIFLFLGTMNYAPNIDAVLFFVERIWPKILQDVPSAQFLIVGRNPDPVVQNLDDGVRVLVTGTVPSVTPYFRKAAVMVVPLRFGSGTRVKILESWAHRLPVVSTRLGAEGLEAEDGRHLLLADSPEDFAKSCVRMFRDTDLRQQLSCEGYAHVSEYFTWEKIESAVQQMVERN